MFKKILLLSLLGMLLGGCSMNKVAESKLKVEVFQAEVATVNSFFIHNDEEGVLVDLLRSSDEAKELVDFVKKYDVKLSRIIITHGHPDHYIGLDVITKAFPNTPVYVYDQSIKDDIIGFSTWMDTVGWLDNEPALKVKSDENVNGFDYENLITVEGKDTFTFENGNVLEIGTDYLATEAAHLTTIYLPEEDIILASDFAYNGVHPWMGAGVALEHVENWKEQLKTFEKKYKSSRVYPGHGVYGDASVFTDLYEYISTFQAEVQTADSNEEIVKKMIALYPEYKQEDFLLVYSAQNIFELTEKK